MKLPGACDALAAARKHLPGPGPFLGGRLVTGVGAHGDQFAHLLQPGMGEDGTGQPPGGLGRRDRS